MDPIQGTEVYPSGSHPQRGNAVWLTIWCNKGHNVGVPRSFIDPQDTCFHADQEATRHLGQRPERMFVMMQDQGGGR